MSHEQLHHAATKLAQIILEGGVLTNTQFQLLLAYNTIITTGLQTKINALEASLWTEETLRKITREAACAAVKQLRGTGKSKPTSHPRAWGNVFLWVLKRLFG